MNTIVRFHGEPLTTREVRIAHEAFVAGAVYGDEETALIMARRRYPFPKVTRPRVMKGNGAMYYRVRDGVLEAQSDTGSCCPHEFRWDSVRHVEWQDAPIIADLLATPTEEVEE